MTKKHKSRHDSITKTMMKSFMYLKQLAVPLGLAVMTVGMILLFGTFLSPFALSVITGVLAGLTFGFVTFMLAKMVGAGMKRMTANTHKLNTTKDSMNHILHAGYVMAALGVTATVITLAATGGWVPAAASGVVVVILTFTAGLASAVLFQEILTVAQNFLQSVLTRFKPSANLQPANDVTLKPTNSSAATILSATSTNAPGENRSTKNGDEKDKTSPAGYTKVLNAGDSKKADESEELQYKNRGPL